MRTVTFTTNDLKHWLDLIEQVFRLNNPKVIDVSKMRKLACKKGIILPPCWQSELDNPLSKLATMAQKLNPLEDIERQYLIDRAWDAINGLIDLIYDSDQGRSLVKRWVRLNFLATRIAITEVLNLKNTQAHHAYASQLRPRADIDG